MGVFLGDMPKMLDFQTKMKVWYNTDTESIDRRKEEIDMNETEIKRKAIHSEGKLKKFANVLKKNLLYAGITALGVIALGVIYHILQYLLIFAVLVIACLCPKR